MIACARKYCSRTHRSARCAIPSSLFPRCASSRSSCRSTSLPAKQRPVSFLLIKCIVGKAGILEDDNRRVLTLNFKALDPRLQSVKSSRLLRKFPYHAGAASSTQNTFLFFLTIFGATQCRSVLRLFRQPCARMTSSQS